MRYILSILTLVFLITPPDFARADAMRILVMGDSFMTSNGSRRASVPHVLARELGAKVTSKAVTGARFVYRLPITGALGLNIPKQWRGGAWDVVVMNGGGNDLWLGCGCGACGPRLNTLITADGRGGIIPATVARARQSGARVIYTGYLRSPGAGSPIEGCRVWGDRLEQRLAQMARRDRGVTFVSLANMVPRGNRSFHAADMIHPSPKGSAAAAARIIREIKRR
ncbi:MAG: SGNH/GDSL hydrolase family protein [Pseudomonadota bacterium]